MTHHVIDLVKIDKHLWEWNSAVFFCFFAGSFFSWWLSTHFKLKFDKYSLFRIQILFKNMLQVPQDWTWIQSCNERVACEKALHKHTHTQHVVQYSCVEFAIMIIAQFIPGCLRELNEIVCWCICCTLYWTCGCNFSVDFLLGKIARR